MYRVVAHPIVESCLRGYSGTIFAYGCTGSGKTHTMLGNHSAWGESRGILPRCFDHIFAASKKSNIAITASYLQIYCEMIFDLLLPSGESNHLSIREKNGSVFVEGLSKSRVTCAKDIIHLLDLGDSNRSTAPTLMNPNSSRSHAALLLNIRFLDPMNNQLGKDQEERYSHECTLVLVDLAGSERSSAAGINYTRLEEAKNINLSLSALGNCMNALAEGRRHIPYRDSKLTRLLQGSLGGGSRTAVVVNIYPGPDTLSEVLHSLKFASRASKVQVTAKISRYIDYEALYFLAQNELDNREEKEKQLTLLLSACKTEVRDKEGQIQNLLAEIETLNTKINQSELISKNTPSKIEGDKSSDKTCFESPTIVHVTTNTIDDLNSNHNAQLAQMKITYETLIEREKLMTTEALQEVGKLQYELKTTQEQFLSTISDLKKERELRIRLHEDSNIRVEELLSELNDCKEKIESFETTQSSFPREIAAFEEKLMHSEKIISEMIPISKVKEMEATFSETVMRLSERVKGLEHAMQASRADQVNGADDCTSNWRNRVKSNSTSSCKNNFPPISDFL